MQSMTGFGTGEWTSGTTRYCCEIKSVNNRFLEVNCRFPKSLAALESDTLALIKAALSRGKVDAYIDVKATTESENLPQLNIEALHHAIALINQAATEAHLVGGAWTAPSLVDLLKIEGVLGARSGPADREGWLAAQRIGVQKVVELAVRDLIRARTQEGQGIQAALLELTRSIDETRTVLESRVIELRQGLFQSYRRRLETLVHSLGDSQIAAVVKAFPDERLTQEIVILAEKSDIEEELKRLGIHTKEFETSLGGDGPQGRRLDFLCQEMHREVNTISSKLFAPDTAPQVLALKQAVERIRQQIQNVE